MPLSDKEQRILRQIEEQLEREDQHQRLLRDRSRRILVRTALWLLAGVVLVVVAALLMTANPLVAFAVLVVGGVLGAFVDHRLRDTTWN